ncbi:hypothetical protein NE237_006170 [Protea cynaroides]|uniref:Nucleoporin Nup54 alpha-helical domain-containing protein n=1 Tax=Protea cynaroides TaxID=273540 RepID=A0A9Q0KMN6_9MAGN|nr:hypothetical protein NE237_006170 [Protea cynaroides]
MFGTPTSLPAFGTPSTPSFTPAFGTSSSTSPLFSTPFTQQQQQTQQQQSPLFQQPSTGFGFQSPSPFGAPQSSPFPQSSPLPFANAQLTTQMAPVGPLPFSLADRDIQAIVDAYKEEPGNPKHAFKHLLFSVTDPSARIKPAGISDIMWAEAMRKLEGMESADRERLWPQLVQGFKDLSLRLKLQDEAMLSDAERLRMTQSNVKMLQRHFQADTIPRIQRMRQKEQDLQRRLLRVMRILEALEGKGCRVPLVKSEAELAEKLAALARQLKGPGAELSRRVHNLLSISRVRANANGGGSIYLPGSTKIDEQSLADMQEVLQQQTEAIARLGNVLKRDVRDMEIIMAEDSGMANGGSKKDFQI